jgi:hypothetical protein
VLGPLAGVHAEQPAGGHPEPHASAVGALAGSAQALRAAAAMRAAAAPMPPPRAAPPRYAAPTCSAPHPAPGTLPACVSHRPSCRPPCRVPRRVRGPTIPPALRGARDGPWYCQRAGPGAAGGPHGSRRDSGAPAGDHPAHLGGAQRPAEVGPALCLGGPPPRRRIGCSSA